MLATHSPKTFDSTVQNAAICAEPLATISNYFISSKTIFKQREFFACPNNAADMKKFLGPDRLPHVWQIPELATTKVKQLILPYSGSYVCVSPVASLAVLHEAFTRFKHKIDFYDCVIQPNPTARQNHGELLVRHAGNLRLMKQVDNAAPLYEQNKNKAFRGNFVLMRGLLSDYNAASGMLCAGPPAVTALGGLVHRMEREAKTNIYFAFSCGKVDLILGQKKGSTLKARGRVIPKIITGEVKAHTEITILLFSNDPIAALNAAKNTTKIAGGDFSPTEIKICENEYAPNLAYFCRPDKKPYSTHNDALDSAIERNKTTERNDGITTIGYAFLETPKDKPLSRANYPHAFSEPVFSPLTTTEIEGKPLTAAIWQRYQTDNFIFWSTL